MALRDQPYIPLYVQDVLTDERLIECSAESHGVYFRLICILHKQEKYGLLCLKQKYKQNKDKVDNFALMMSRQMPFEQRQILRSLKELSDEGVINITQDELSQKRMVYDGELSLTRSKVGKKGGSNVTKQYGKSGYFYLMSDTYDRHKIGISVNTKNRLYRLRSDLNLSKNFDIIQEIPVSDMGQAEDYAHEFFKDILDGEWLIGEYNDILKKFDLLKAKTQANTEDEDESESEDESKNSLRDSEFKIFWEEYDKKVAKDKTYKLFIKLPVTDIDNLRDYIPRYKKAQPDKQYRKNPDVFLRNRAWEDELIMPSQNENGEKKLVYDGPQHIKDRIRKTPKKNEN